MSNLKLKQLTHYVVWKCEDPAKLGATKLNKVLWLSDLLAYKVNGTSITGTEYVKRQFGPVPRSILVARRELVAEKKLHERTDVIAGMTGMHFTALERPDTSVFSPKELEIVDSVLSEICENHTATSISEYSHDAVWGAAKMGEVIPMFAWLAGAPAELSDDDFVWADTIIADIEGMNDVA